MLDFSPVLALTGLKTRPQIDGFLKNPSSYRRVLKTRPKIDGFFKPVNSSTGFFLTCLAENRFIKPVIAYTGLFHLSDQLTCLNNKRVY